MAPENGGVYTQRVPHFLRYRYVYSIDCKIWTQANLHYRYQTRPQTPVLQPEYNEIASHSTIPEQAKFEAHWRASLRMIHAPKRNLLFHSQNPYLFLYPHSTGLHRH